MINCVPCHRNDGGGNTIGPNLTDNFWLHGGAVKNVFSTVNTGFVEKGMPAWGKTMSQGDVRDVTFFVLSLQGTNPANPKAPQGEPMEQKVIQKSDSLKSEASL
jgi:cytochrome c oxidase cbb3-type subunit 3